TISNWIPSAASWGWITWSTSAWGTGVAPTRSTVWAAAVPATRAMARIKSTPKSPAPRKMARLPIVRTSPPLLRFGRVTPAWGSPNPKPSPPVQPPGPVAAQVLDPLDQHHQHRHGDQHHVRPEPLVPVPDGQVAQPAAPHGPGRGRVAHQGDGRDGPSENEGRDRFGQVDLPDHLPGTGPHGDRRLHHARIHLVEGAFH